MGVISLLLERNFGRLGTLSRVEMSRGFLSREGLGNMGAARAREQLAERAREHSEQ